MRNVLNSFYEDSIILVSENWTKTLQEGENYRPVFIMNAKILNKMLAN